MSKIHVFGIAGPAGAGKSTLAGMIIDVARHKGLATHKIAFADPLKAMACRMGWDGKKDERGRKLLQLLGTQCGRKLIHEDCWVRLWNKQVKLVTRTVLSTPQLVVADDVRFANEVRVITENRGLVISVVRPGVEYTHDHASENGIDSANVHLIVKNNGSESDLYQKAVSIVTMLKQ